jgi:hypothetical protein
LQRNIFLKKLAHVEAGDEPWAGFTRFIAVLNVRAFGCLRIKKFLAHIEGVACGLWVEKQNQEVDNQE